MPPEFACEGPPGNMLTHHSLTEQACRKLSTVAPITLLWSGNLKTRAKAPEWERGAGKYIPEILAAFCSLACGSALGPYGIYNVLLYIT
jgi:hypothetical protein